MLLERVSLGFFFFHFVLGNFFFSRCNSFKSDLNCSSDFSSSNRMTKSSCDDFSRSLEGGEGGSLIMDSWTVEFPREFSKRLRS